MVQADAPLEPRLGTVARSKKPSGELFLLILRKMRQGVTVLPYS